MPAARHLAVLSAGHAGATDGRPHFVDAARGRLPDLADKRAAADAVAAHAAFVGGDEAARDQRDLGVAFQAEARPVGGVGAAGAAGLAAALVAGEIRDIVQTLAVGPRPSGRLPRGARRALRTR